MAAQLAQQSPDVAGAAKDLSETDTGKDSALSRSLRMLGVQ